MSDVEPAVLVGNLVDDPDLPYRVVCDHCRAVVGHARIVDQVGDVYQYQWRHDEPDHRCELPLVREARALIDAPADDPRRAQFAARKDALLAEVEK